MKISIHGTVVKVDAAPIGIGRSDFVLTIELDDGGFIYPYGVGPTERVPKVGDRIDYESSERADEGAK